MTAGLSITTFNIDRYTTLESFLREYRGIGLNTVELNGRVPQEVIDELLPYIDRGDLRISSLHNFCPKPVIGIDEKELQLSSLDEQKRCMAVSLTRKTIETAERVGAKAVVLHMGKVEGLSEIERKLSELYRAGRRGDDEFLCLRNELIDKRFVMREKYVDASSKSLCELSEFIVKKGYSIKLGLENRYRYYEIPTVSEYDLWFDKYRDHPVFFWYDFGHGEVLRKLSLLNRDELFNRHGNRLIGLHIHDCSGIDDHLVPGSGDIDFSFIKSYLRPDVLRVLEYGRRFELNDIAGGIDYLKRTGILDM